MQRVQIELAKVGVFGEAGTAVTEKDLQEIVETFEGEVPVVLGHQLADFMPAFGWVKNVKYDEEKKTLYGEVELNDILASAFKEGLYKKWSVGIRRRGKDGKAYLHHVAFLGATPPAIKDLKVVDAQVVNFSDAGKVERWVFADDGEGRVKPPPLSELEIVDREWDVNEARKRVYEKYGIDGFKAYCLYRDPEADPENKTAYKFLVVDIVDGKPKIIARALSTALAYLHGARGVNIPESIREKVEPRVRRLLEEWKKEKEKKKGGKQMADMKKDTTSGKVEKMSKELADLRKEKEELERKLRKEKLEALGKSLEGKLPKDKHHIVFELADRLSIEENIELADESGKKMKKSALDLLIEIFRHIPMPVEPGKKDLGDTSSEVKLSEMVKCL